MSGLHDSIVALVVALSLLLLGGAAANAQSYEDALAGFTTDSFNDTDAAILAVAAMAFAHGGWAIPEARPN